MENKNMREISMDEMDRVSGGSGENPRNKTGCPYCSHKDIITIVSWSDGNEQYHAKDVNVSGLKNYDQYIQPNRLGKITVQ